MDKLINILILLGLGISFFGILYFSQDYKKLRFVISNNSEYCYIEGEHRKDFVVSFVFENFQDCRYFLNHQTK